MSVAAQATERKKPGPKPGSKRATKVSASTKPPKVGIAPPPGLNGPDAAVQVDQPLSAADRENPNKISGQALRELAHRRGMAKSELEDMPDEKIRMQLRYITSRMSEESEA